jgi:uncharacterized protein YbaP (TraB family)
MAGCIRGVDRAIRDAFLAEIMKHFHRAVMLIASAQLNMRARFAVTVLAVLVLGWAPLSAAQRFDRGLLWRIEGGGAPASHVFGTIHLSDPRVTKLPAEVSGALSKSRSLTVEVGLDPANLMALAGRMVFLDGRDLPGALGPELYEKTALVTGKLGIPEPALRMFRPWAIALLLSVPQQNPTEVLDFVLASTARAEGKPIHELESVGEQVAVFEDMPEGDQVVLLRRAVENYEYLPRAINRLVEAWLARDLVAMLRISEEMAGSDAQVKRLNETLLRRLLNERNVRMAERMQARLKEGGAFIAVGALHLYGGSGVLTELERRGWRVTRVY